MNRIKAFILGMWECRGDLTFACPTHKQQVAYDKGRTIGRRLLGIERRNHL